MDETFYRIIVWVSPFYRDLQTVDYWIQRAHATKSRESYLQVWLPNENLAWEIQEAVAMRGADTEDTSIILCKQIIDPLLASIEFTYALVFGTQQEEPLVTQEFAFYSYWNIPGVLTITRT